MKLEVELNSELKINIDIFWMQNTSYSDSYLFHSINKSPIWYVHVT